MEVSTLQKSMELTMNKCRKESEGEHVTSTSNEVDWFVFLTDDILLDILKRLPDAFLRFKAKYVCKRWFSISTNKILLDHASFILQKSNRSDRVRLVDISEEGQGLQVKEQNLDIPCFDRIKSWYNEFLLISDSSRRKSLYVFNLITKETVYLPQCHTPCQGHRTSRCGVALFFDEIKGVYKAVHFYPGLKIQFHILILERDIVSGLSSSNWKKMEVPSDIEELVCYQCNPVSVQVQGRYFHCDVHCSDYLVSVDLVKEEVFKISLPRSDDRTSGLYSIIEMGGFLTLIDGDVDIRSFLDKLADVWILKDFQRMKWDKLQSITVPDYCFRKYPGNYFMFPVCGVISKRYIVFQKPGSRMCSYDLKFGVVTELNINFESAYPYVVRSSAPSFMEACR